MSTELRIPHLALENTFLKKAEDKATRRKDFLETVIESLAHPFYVIDTEDYSIRAANSAVKQNVAAGAITCYAITHHESAPCSGMDHPSQLIPYGKPVAPR